MGTGIENIDGGENWLFAFYICQCRIEMKCKGAWVVTWDSDTILFVTIPNAFAKLTSHLALKYPLENYTFIVLLVFFAHKKI